MKNYKVTINGKTYDVGVEEAEGGAEVKAIQAAAPAPKAAAPAAAPAPKAAPAAPAAAAPAAPVKAGSGDVTAPLAGTVLSIAVTEGQQVKAGQVLLIFEAMKMENEILAPCAGTVKKINVAKGAVLETGMCLLPSVNNQYFLKAVSKCSRLRGETGIYHLY